MFYTHFNRKIKDLFNSAHEFSFICAILINKHQIADAQQIQNRRHKDLHDNQISQGNPPGKCKPVWGAGALLQTGEPSSHHSITLSPLLRAEIEVLVKKNY